MAKHTHTPIPRKGVRSPSLTESVSERKASKEHALPPPAIAAAEQEMPMPTVQKIFRLRWDTVQALRGAVLEMSAGRGKRITETEVVEQLIRSRLRMDN